MRETTKQTIRELSSKWFDYVSERPELITAIGLPRLEAEKQFCLKEMPELACELATFEDLRQMDVCLCAHAIRDKAGDPDYMPYLDFLPVHFDLLEPLDRILRTKIKPVSQLEPPLDRFDEDLATMYLVAEANRRKLVAITRGDVANPGALDTYRAELAEIDGKLRLYHGRDLSKIVEARMREYPWEGEEYETDYLLRWAELIVLSLEWLKSERDRRFPPRSLIDF